MPIPEGDRMWLAFALKGQNVIAQGNALGKKRVQFLQSPDGARPVKIFS